MCTTNHTVQVPLYQANKVSVNHSHLSAVQYDFYIPAAIWDAKPTRIFLKRLLSVVDGATVFDRLTGVWRGDEEDTRIYRMIIRTQQLERDNIRNSFQNEIGRLIAELSVTALKQEAVLFTETDIFMLLSKIPQLDKTE